MILDETLGNIERCARHLRAEDPEFDRRPAVVAAPGWFIDQVRSAFRDKMESPTDEIDQLHGLKVVRNDDAPDICVVDHAGKVYNCTPDWARKASQGSVS